MNLGPFGSRCKMAVVEGMDRKSDAYLKFLEDKFIRHKLAEKGKDPESPKEQDLAAAAAKSNADMKLVLNSLHDITGRLSRLETNATVSTDPSGAAGVSGYVSSQSR